MGPAARVPVLAGVEAGAHAADDRAIRKYVISREVDPAGARADRDFEIYNVGFDAAWELDFFGRVRRSIEARTAEVEVTEASRHDVIVSLTAEVARSYFELHGTQHRLEVARKNAANQQETLNLTLVRLEAGRGTEIDTARSRPLSSGRYIASVS